MSLRRRCKKGVQGNEYLSSSQKMDNKMAQHTTTETSTEIRNINSVQKEIKNEFSLKHHCPNGEMPKGEIFWSNLEKRDFCSEYISTEHQFHVI